MDTFTIEQVRSIFCFGIFLDCYAGSGTFLEASKNKGNTFIGIEKEVKYYELAVARVFG